MEVDGILDIIQNFDLSPLRSWSSINEFRDVLEKRELDAACSTKIARSILPTLGLLRDHHNLDDEALEEVLLGMQFFVAHYMDAVNSSEGPGIVFDCLDELHKRSPRSARFIDLVSELQNTIVDHFFVRTPESQAPSQSRKISNLWIDAVIYATEVSRFDTTSMQVATLCRSIGDTFFGGTKLTSVLKKLADITLKTDKTRTDFPYLFDLEIVALVKRYSSEHGAFTGYSFLWAVLEAFLLRMKSEPEYLSILKLIVHLLQALGIPIKCMATPSLLEYPQSEISEDERLFHMVKILEIYVASNLHHPSVLVKTQKRFNGKLIFQDIATYILKHDARGTTTWYSALMQLGAISPSIITAKLRMILQSAWFDCDADDVEAQDTLILYLVDLYDKMSRPSDFYCKFPGAINDYLEKPRAEPRLSEKVLRGMRRSFATLGSDEVIAIWSDYIRYFKQVITKWGEKPDELCATPQLFTLRIFTEFIQHCPLVPMVQLTQEQHEAMDSALTSTIGLTEILLNVMDAVPEKTRELRSHFFKVSQNFIKASFARRCYLQNAFHHAFEEASIRQNDLVQRFEADHRAQKKNKRMKLDLNCYGAKFSEKPKEDANRCLLYVCENFDSLDWQVYLINNPHVLKSASKKQIEVFVGLLYESIRDQEETRILGNSLYLRSQVFRDCSRQVLCFVKYVARDLLANLVELEQDFESVFDVDDIMTPVKWAKLTSLLDRLEPRSSSTSAVRQANEMLGCVPIQSLPTPIRLMFLGLFGSLAVIRKNPTDEFLCACFYHLAAWSSALKVKDDIDENGPQISISVSRLATLFLERVLSIDPYLDMSRTSVKETIDLIRYNLFVTAKTAESVHSFESIIEQLPLKNEAQLCTMLHLVETATRVHSRKISSEEVLRIKSRCQGLVNKHLKKSASKLENVVFLINKYSEVFGVADAAELKCFSAAIESATETIRLSKPDIVAFQLYLKAADFDDVINCFLALRAILVVGKEFFNDFNRQLDSSLAEKLWPLLEETWDSMGAPHSARLFTLSLGDEVDPPSCTRPVPEQEVLCERFLEVTLALVKYLSRANLIKLVVQIHRIIAVQTLYCSYRVDLCCAILDAIARKHASPELVQTIQAAFGSIPWDRLNNAPVEQWCTIMSLTADVYCRAFVSKANFTNGTAPILLSSTGKLIEAVVKRCDGHCGKVDVSALAGIVRVIDSLNRLLVLLNRQKARDHTRSIETVGPFLLAAYLRSIVGSSVHETFRPDLKAMALLALALCNPKSLLSLKLERPKVEQEVLRRLVEDCKSKFQ